MSRIAGGLLLGLLLSCHTAWAGKSDVEMLGDYFMILLPTSAWVSTQVQGDKEGEVQLYQSFFTTMGLTYALKAGVDKERPDGSNNQSFPSGHSSAAFSGAVFLQRRRGWALGVPAYLAASFVAYSRVHARRHDEVDVISGAAIGLMSGIYFVRPAANLSLSLTRLDHSPALRLAARW